MKLDIRTRHLLLSAETLAELRRRVNLVFARISPRIRTVDVTVADINGPKGGADKQCRLVVRGRSTRSIAIEQVGTDTLATVAMAASRAEQALLRELSRRRGFAPIVAS